jgi:hypothetical protein
MARIAMAAKKAADLLDEYGEFGYLVGEFIPHVPKFIQSRFVCRACFGGPDDFRHVGIGESCQANTVSPVHRYSYM